MVGSVMQLSLSGLSCYVEELVRTISSISVTAGSGTTVIPAIPVLLGGGLMSGPSPPVDEPGLLDSVLSAATKPVH